MTRSEGGPLPPVARVERKTRRIHGHELADDYAWLRERQSQEVIDYLEAENTYTRAVMRHTEKLQQELYDQMLGRIKQTDVTAPVPMGGFYYYTRTEEGKQYSILCRKRGSLEAAEEVLLDVNGLAEGKDYMAIGATRPSPDHKLFAYSADENGSEQFTLYVKDLETGELLPDVIPAVSWGLVWGNDNRTLFYTTRDDAKRPYKAWRHLLGTDRADDELLHHEEDERFWMGLTRTRSREYVMLLLGSQVTSEVRYLDANRPRGDFALLRARKQGVEYSVGHRGDSFYVLTNEDATNFKLMKTPVVDTRPEAWQEVIPHRIEVRLADIDLFRDHLVVQRREHGLKRIGVWDLESGESHDIEFSEPVYAAWAGDNEEFHTSTLRFEYSSLVTPHSVFDYDMRQRTRVLRKQQEVLGGYDAGRYTSERVFARAPDGTEIPLSLVHRKGLERDGSRPCLLNGYGSYGYGVEPMFSSNVLSLLDRGFVYVLAHVRGGGELGRPWYEDGKLLKKKNTFTDFIAAAEYLVRERYTSSERLAARGGSAGGLLMGAVANMRPDLFGIVAAHVPFVDVMSTMLDRSIPLTVVEYEEWGDPNDQTAFEYMLSYSPYDNVRAQDYPHILVTAGLNDPRVQYWEPAKWTARLRAAKTDANRLLLKTEMGSGHAGPSGRYDGLREVAFEFAFLLDLLGKVARPMDLVRISRELGRAAGRLAFGPPVAFVYNPLAYARQPHELYLRRFGLPGCEALLVGMNPGPWGMVQTGVPFGEVGLVRDWMGIEAAVDKPPREHPKRPIQGFACGRSEVSGKRLWGWARDRFATPERFFERFFVWNYCPLAFLEESGRNRTPDKLSAAERAPLFTLCDQALARVVKALGPRLVLGVGGFAEARAREALAGREVDIGTILHPSPASPLANRGWAAQAEAQLRKLGLLL